MKMVNIARALFFVLGVVTTISTSQFFKSCNLPDKPDGHAVVLFPPVAPQQQKEMAAYDQRIAALTTEKVTLQQQVTDNRVVLNRTQRKAALLETQLQQQITNTTLLTDTAQRFANCDSLAQTASALIQSCQQKDSLYDNLASALEQQVSNRDSTITTQAEQHNYLQLNYDRNLSAQQLLLTENLQLRRDTKRQRVKSRLLSAGLLLLGGTATYMALHH